MPRYRAKERVFVDNSLREPGEEFVTDAPMHPTAWELIDKTAAPAKAAKAAAESAPVDDPYDRMDEEQLRNFITTKGGKQPGAKASLEALRTAARAAAGVDGAS